MPSDDSAPDGLRLTIPADGEGVRAALGALFDTLMLRALPEATRGTAELVLAEVLNNIVEHACAPDGGEIELMLSLADGALTCQIVDRGHPMPGGALPVGRLPPLDPANLPEGGFGWYLIRSLSEELRYERKADSNRLTFRVPAQPDTKQTRL